MENLPLLIRRWCRGTIRQAHWMERNRRIECILCLFQSNKSDIYFRIQRKNVRTIQLSFINRICNSLQRTDAWPRNVCISAEQKQVRINENNKIQSKYSDLHLIISKSRKSSNFKNQPKLRKKKPRLPRPGGRSTDVEGRPFTFPETKPLRWTITLSELNSCTSSVRICYKKLCLDWTLYLRGNFQFKVFNQDVFVSSRNCMHHCWLGSWILISDFFLFYDNDKFRPNLSNKCL
jgi:hypothetical protein